MAYHLHNLFTHYNKKLAIAKRDSVLTFPEQELAPAQSQRIRKFKL